MNQIEIWFGIINRRLLKRKSYPSVNELKASILRFIEQYNIMAKPFKWIYKGKEKDPEHIISMRSLFIAYYAEKTNKKLVIGEFKQREQPKYAHAIEFAEQMNMMLH